MDDVHEGQMSERNALGQFRSARQNVADDSTQPGGKNEEDATEEPAFMSWHEGMHQAADEEKKDTPIRARRHTRQMGDFKADDQEEGRSTKHIEEIDNFLSDGSPPTMLFTRPALIGQVLFRLATLTKQPLFPVWAPLN